MTTTQHNRRGVTLLLVLALMVIFAMLTTTFVIVTTQARRTAEITAQHLIEPKSGGTTSIVYDRSSINKALDVLLTGSLDNVVGPHSILENLYGHPNYIKPDNTTAKNLEGTVQNAAILPNGLLSLELNWDASKDYGNYQFPDLTGHVLTVSAVPDPPTEIQKRLLHQSKMIVTAPVVDTVGNVFEIASFKVSLNGVDDLPPEDVTAALKDCVCIINTPVFSGTGPGYQAATSPGTALLTDTTDSQSKPWTLRPNVLAPEADGSQPYKTYLSGDRPTLTNPDYTAPDYRTMFLAWNDVRLVGTDWKLNKIIPSFHRPQLVKYWNEIGNITELRKVVLRPLPGDHPNFTGSNPAATSTATSNLQKFLTEGPWDVDNDGDGVADGIWLDIGLPPLFDPRTNTQYKPLVSYYVVDMDGRLNVNVHGNLDNIQPSFTDYPQFADKTKFGSLNNVHGTGAGPAEVQVNKGQNNAVINDANWEEVIKKRYAANALPDNEAELKTNGINSAAYQLGGVTPDWSGMMPLQFDSLGNRFFTPPANGSSPNPYWTNQYKPFEAADLEFILRSVGDTDYENLVSTRLRSLFGNDNAQDNTAEMQKFSRYRHHVTTQSSDIPSPSRTITKIITGEVAFSRLYYYIFNVICGDDPVQAQTLWNLLPEEVRRGEKVNLNRLTLRNDWTTETNHDELLRAKARFAQEIFYLLRVLCYDQIETGGGYHEGSISNKDAVITRLAQWSVNLVDFIDPDATMTPFVFNTQPLSSCFDNAQLIERVVNGTLVQDDLNDVATSPRLIWGFEKPEVALTETFAVHNRRVADTDTGQRTNDSITQDNDFDQVLRPEGSLFVELYRQGNPKRQGYPGDLVQSGTNKLNLAQQTAGNDYVWRLAVGQKTVTTSNQSNFDWTHTSRNRNYDALYQSTQPGNYSFQTHQWQTIQGDSGFSNTQIKPDRIIWFGNVKPTAKTGKTDPQDELNNRSFVNTNDTDVALAANEYLVIAPRTLTLFESLPLGPGIPFGTPNPGNTGNQIDTAAMITNRSKVMIADGVNVSEPLPPAAYPPLPAIADEPFDENELLTFGTIPCYRTICLQRLADPKRDHHPITNPYVTVDWNMIDLHVINSESDPDGAAAETTFTASGDLTMSSRQWGTIGGTADTVNKRHYPNLWSRLRGAENPKLGGLVGTTAASGTKATLDQDHITFGSLNQFDGVNKMLPDPDSDSDYDYAPDRAFLHFPWNDAPLTNTFELMLVPATTPGQFGVEFYDNETANLFGDAKSLGVGTTARFRNPTSNIGPYLNFYHSENDSNSSLNLARLFEYVRVPSRFAGTIQEWTTDAVPKQIYEMREPGKINLNTVTESAWQSLGANRTDWLSYENLLTLRQGTLGDDSPSEFAFPFRSPQASALVPPLKTGHENDLVRKPVETTLLRSGLITLPNASGNGTNPYTALENVMRLSDVTTVRSNVFAVWITVGYFNVEKFETVTALKTKYPDTDPDPKLTHITDETVFKAVYPDGCVLGTEKGLEDGTVKRQRSFYLIDRSIPVGFRRGEVFNSRNVIVKESPLD